MLDKQKRTPTAMEDRIYWKPKSKRWFFAAVTTVLFALAIDVLVPDVQKVNTLYYQIALSGFAITLVGLWIVSVYADTLRKKLYQWSQFIFVMGIVLAAWDLLSTKSDIFHLPFFPGPAQIIQVMVTERNVLLISSFYSLRLFFVGLISGIILGVVTGVLIGWSRQWNYWLFPVIKISGVIPSVAWIPVAIVIFPTSFITGMFLITIASWFSIAFMVSTGISSTSKAYYEVARTLGASERYVLFHIAIPNSVPNIFTGISTATGLAFLTLVVSEMVGAKAGLGWYINWARAWAAYDKVYASIVIMGIAFSIILAVITLFRNYFLRWQKGIVVAVLLGNAVFATGCCSENASTEDKALYILSTYSDEHKIPYDTAALPLGNIVCRERALDIRQSPFYPSYDFYRMKSAGSLTLVKHFKTIQQTTEVTCGPACTLMVLEHFGKRGNLNEKNLTALRGTAQDTTWLRHIKTIFDAVGGFKYVSSFNYPNPEDITHNLLINYLKRGIPVIIGTNDWGGHWQVAIGYDTLGTRDTADDILILADPYDTTDHNQDGYLIYSWQQLYYGNWRNHFDPDVHWGLFFAAWPDTTDNGLEDEFN
jgi:NitT/TauT family transport system permease protein